jgi:hypothetical protein
MDTRDISFSSSNIFVAFRSFIVPYITMLTTMTQEEKRSEEHSYCRTQTNLPESSANWWARVPDPLTLKQSEARPNMFSPSILSKESAARSAQVCHAPALVVVDLFKYKEIIKVWSCAMLRCAVVWAYLYTCKFWNVYSSTFYWKRLVNFASWQCVIPQVLSLQHPLLYSSDLVLCNFFMSMEIKVSL